MQELVDRVSVNSHDLVLSVHELAHIRGAKLLELRKEVNVSIPVRAFSKLYQSTTQFIEASEVLASKKRALGLHGVITSQAKGFLDHFHQEKVSIIASLIENETWTQAEIPAEFQKLVDDVAARSFGLADPLVSPPETLSKEEATLDDGDGEQVTPFHSLDEFIQIPSSLASFRSFHFCEGWRRRSDATDANGGREACGLAKVYRCGEPKVLHCYLRPDVFEVPW